MFILLSLKRRRCELVCSAKKGQTLGGGECAYEMVMDARSNIFMAGYTAGGLQGNTNAGNEEFYSEMCSSLWQKLLLKLLFREYVGTKRKT